MDIDLWISVIAIPYFAKVKLCIYSYYIYFGYFKLFKFSQILIINLLKVLIHLSTGHNEINSFFWFLSIFPVSKIFSLIKTSLWLWNYIKLVYKEFIVTTFGKFWNIACYFCRNIYWLIIGKFYRSFPLFFVLNILWQQKNIKRLLEVILSSIIITGIKLCGNYQV